MIIHNSCLVRSVFMQYLCIDFYLEIKMEEMKRDPNGRQTKQIKKNVNAKNIARKYKIVKQQRIHRVSKRITFGMHGPPMPDDK